MPVYQCFKWIFKDRMLLLQVTSKLKYFKTKEEQKWNGKRVGEFLVNDDYKEIIYTIQIDWEGGTVWLNSPISKERIVITEKDLNSITHNFKLLEARRKGLI